MTARSTTIRDRHRRQIRRSKPDCWLCGRPIDYEAHWLDPLSFVVDHVIPIAKGGLDELENKRAAHRSCNRTKSDKVLPPLTVVKPVRTSRSW